MGGLRLLKRLDFSFTFAHSIFVLDLARIPRNHGGEIAGLKDVAIIPG